MADSVKKLTKEDIKHIAQLANLDIDNDELEAYSKQLTDSLHYVENLEDIDTSGVPDTFFTTHAKNSMQEDVIDESVTLPQEEVLQNAPKKRNGYFVVKRIL
ncbi:hypothetical protein A3H80_00440 [Candidatus Roizmanbacteria bacterium RIFCSPLOWO2_02_FULL_37_19]|uniref:Aspartyl/glutamyl-tRNA(Asn/Gln) amidotransferase subunit C n=1 Tax=Candidatus Roizmanbacteria bacterium RIFCSPHIGHO2_02_FULL_37_24 TaxID=1802037 RepID=A0A1F7GY86_9BACT|nr:MAG: hypothetical protein A2862_04920 [Candidatus Roizmanbacteria bacterium RIFCSPHIGHO2_01_FULL_38_41]OGK23755.1 MAG: hypothetical protein A3C24_04925 [Candidatus Roizmanbacteria bacterium RIFCSPHIGHO2_02_FULL_37_24]OGK32672.1 MAG: hypothetical protein A3E10_01620 [Candidatus Roizmanbacteria bacterium RIFCSPHIGHO2_12_FULL_37_23]OGK44762.1 MAG: hypothetical protein A2956_01530 [Candidatus Roizmanbacteria bacterium RIFCSPLOWO2_01_FULL_37_57]OGK53986.1 MAG: hypothetical protein A3H80_00440 [Ca